jgi:hypothetical protein
MWGSGTVEVVNGNKQARHDNGGRTLTVEGMTRSSLHRANSMIIVALRSAPSITLFRYKLAGFSTWWSLCRRCRPTRIAMSNVRPVSDSTS